MFSAASSAKLPASSRKFPSSGLALARLFAILMDFALFCHSLTNHLLNPNVSWLPINRININILLLYLYSLRAKLFLEEGHQDILPLSRIDLEFDKCLFLGINLINTSRHQAWRRDLVSVRAEVEKIFFLDKRLNG